jgi:hypothetical protein
MKIEFSLYQADAYAEASSTLWDAFNEFRKVLKIAPGIRFDECELLDILNGYGYEDWMGRFYSSSSILAGQPDQWTTFESWLEIYSSDAYPEEIGYDGYANDVKLTSVSDVRRLKCACEIYRAKVLALSYAHGTDHCPRDLKRAYTFRKELMRLLGEWEF